MKSSSSRTSWPQITLFVVLLTVFSAVFNYIILRAHALRGAGGLYTVGITWSFGLAAMLTMKLSGRNLSELGWKWPTARYARISWLIPLAYSFIAYAFIWITGLGKFPNREFMASRVEYMGLHASPTASTIVYVVLTGTYGILGIMVTALGEEIGWRGFLVPELYKSNSFIKTVLFSGVIWTLVHFPVLIWADYNAGTPKWYEITCFTVLVMSLSLIFAWIRLKSGSLWTGVLLHASHNLYIQRIFTPLTADAGHTAWYIDEFGLVVPLIVAALAFYFFTRRNELQPSVI
jgi:membrane protease YdiL (CAAX protease family)